MKKTIIASAVLSVISFGAMAETPSFDYVEFGFTEYDSDGLGKLDGFELTASKELNNNFYVAGDLARVNEGGFDLDTMTIGVGYKNQFSSNSTFFSEIDFAKIKNSNDFDENGFQVTAGIRSMLGKNLELKAAVEYLDINDVDETSYVVGGAYNLNSDLAVYADYTYESELSKYGVGIRYNF
ncbi:MAG: porin [Kangiellaceae bacterium]|jgi:Gram-negative porin